MSNIPSVSVVMPTYNGVAHLRRQLDSILKQEGVAVALYVSDDNSTDGTREVLDDYESRGLITTTTNSGQRGLHCNMASALNMAATDLVAISDQDDIWLPNKLQTLVASLGDADAVFCDSALIDEGDAPISPSLLKELGISRPEIGRHFLRLIRVNSVSGHGLLFRRKLLPDILPFVDACVYDQQIALVAAMRGGVNFVPEALTLHRQHGGNHHNKLAVVSRDEQPKEDRESMRQRQRKNELDMIRFALARKPDKLGLRARWDFFLLSIIEGRLTGARRRFRDPVLLLAVWCIARDFFRLLPGNRSNFRRTMSYARRVRDGGGALQ
jgi:glycosyltransferase involved in cell wall biosynthesis